MPAPFKLTRIPLWKSRENFRKRCGALLVLMTCIAGFAQEVPKTPTTTAHADGLKIVRAYADAMLDPAKGRDHFGPQPTPLFATVLDRKTYAIPEGKADDLYRARVPQEHKFIANPHYDQNLFQVLHALTAVTGEARYAQEADRTMEFFLKNCHDPKWGFFTWGEHLGWDVTTEMMGGFPTNDAKNAAIHEFFRPWIYWDKSFQLAPTNCHRYAQALWKYQIDHSRKPLSWSRHVQLLSDPPNRRGYEFPRHGGFYIATWAHAWKHTRDPVMLEAIEAVADYFRSARDPKTGAIPHCSTEPHHWFRPESTVSLAISLWDAAPLVPEPLGNKLCELARSIDDAFLKLPHDPGPGGKGLVLTADTRNLKTGQLWMIPAGPLKGWHGKQPPGTTIAPRHKAYTEGWVSAYVGPVPHSTMIGFCVERHRQAPSEGYRKLILRTADGYLESEPSLKPYVEDGVKITPKVDTGTVGRVIGLMNYAWRLTGEEKYLRRAEWFCDWSAQKFWGDGLPLPLPTVPFSEKQNFYSASARSDTLAMNMLETWLLRHKPELKIQFRWTDL